MSRRSQLKFVQRWRSFCTAHLHTHAHTHLSPPGFSESRQPSADLRMGLLRESSVLGWFGFVRVLDWLSGVSLWSSRVCARQRHAPTSSRFLSLDRCLSFLREHLRARTDVSALALSSPWSPTLNPNFQYCFVFNFTIFFLSILTSLFVYIFLIFIFLILVFSFFLYLVLFSSYLFTVSKQKKSF